MNNNKKIAFCFLKKVQTRIKWIQSKWYDNHSCAIFFCNIKITHFFRIFSGHLLSSLMTIGSKQPIEYLIRLISDWVHRNSSALRLIVINSPLKACCTLKTTHLGKKHSSIISRSEKNGYHYSTHFRFDASALVKLLVILSKEEMNLLTGGIASYFQIGFC